jgi:hypothetical protein
VPIATLQAAASRDRPTRSVTTSDSELAADRAQLTTWLDPCAGSAVTECADA